MLIPGTLPLRPLKAGIGSLSQFLGALGRPAFPGGLGGEWGIRGSALVEVHHLESVGSEPCPLCPRSVSSPLYL